MGVANPLEQFLHSGAPLLVLPDGQMIWNAAPPCALLPGSFNPLHQAHWRLAHHAAAILGQPVAFELSVANVDKPPLTQDDLRRRLTQFAWRASVWLTHAPRFVDKAERFPGTCFIVGVDTALRLVSPRYYADETYRDEALRRLRDLECRFLVACRVVAEGTCLGLDDVPIPSEHREMFQEIPEEHFRWDISSTELRQRGDTL